MLFLKNKQNFTTNAINQINSDKMITDFFIVHKNNNYRKIIIKNLRAYHHRFWHLKLSQEMEGMFDYLIFTLQIL